MQEGGRDTGRTRERFDPRDDQLAAVMIMVTIRDISASNYVAVPFMPFLLHKAGLTIG